MANTKIFIADDDEFYANILEAKIASLGDYIIEKFYSGRSCIENSYKQPDIILLDYKLGDTTGFEVLKEIKSTYPKIHIVMISGQKEMKVAINSLKFGATDYLLKGYDDCDQTRLKQIIDDCDKITRSRENFSQKNKWNFLNILF